MILLQFESYIKKGIAFKSYFGSKINKVFLPYGIITVIFYLYLFLEQQQPGRVALLYNILCIDYDRQMDGTMWYMSYILIWYIVFFFVFYFDYHSIFKIGFIYLISSAFSVYWLSDIFKDCAYQFSLNAYSFPSGLLVGYAMTTIRSKWGQRTTSVINTTNLGRLIGIIGALLFIAGNLEWITLQYWQYGLCELAVLYNLIHGLLKKHDLKLLKLIGANSFMLYLIEAKIIKVMADFGLAGQNIIIYLLIYFVCISLSVGLINYVQKKWHKLSE